jgi:fructose/tagatose bisphosphate aldolase
VLTSEDIVSVVEAAVFAAEESDKQKARRSIREAAQRQGIIPSSIQGLYEAAGRGEYHGVTVPAINVRGLTFHVARAVFRAALENRVGAFVFEIARSEMAYTRQEPDEYAVVVLAAALKEGFKGPIFLQGDHFQVNAARFSAEPQKELSALRNLIRESIEAGFLNIDIDASTLVDLGQADLAREQENNCRVTADLTKYLRSMQPGGVTISVGGEIGEVGGRNSTVSDLRAFMEGYIRLLGPGVKGISKISVQTGTTHGGVVLPDGSIAKVEIDFKALGDLSHVSRTEYGMAGAVQHGASTLPEEAFALFPKAGAAEIHLATGFQNIIYDSPDFPKELSQQINSHLLDKYSSERKRGDTEEQFIYKTRKKAFGDFKKEIWNIPDASSTRIRETLEGRFALLFRELNVVNTVDLVNRYLARQPLAG